SYSLHSTYLSSLPTRRSSDLGQLTALAPWLMALLIFVWTPSHFWALAMRAVGDYSKAGIPMLPVLVGEKKTAQYIALNTFLLVPDWKSTRLNSSHEWISYAVF